MKVSDPKLKKLLRIKEKTLASLRRRKIRQMKEKDNE